MNIACSPAQIASKLVIQIQNLVTNPGFPLKTPERSPLFQIAAHLEVPPLCPSTTSTGAITDKTFAAIRQEALKASAARVRRKNSTNRIGLSTACQTPQSV